MGLVSQSVSEGVSVSVSVKFRVHGTYCPPVSQSVYYVRCIPRPALD